MYVAYAALMIMCRCAWYPLYTILEGIFRCRLGVDEELYGERRSEPCYYSCALQPTFPTRP